ncbi:MAG: glutathione S-transferase [Henriciella sp.]
MTEVPVLYSFRRCPYAMRARMALAISGQKCRLREIILRDKPEEMLAASPKGTVPVLVLPNGHCLDESLDIVNWALDKNDPENWRGTTTAHANEIAALVKTFDTGFKHHLDRYKYASRYADADASYHRGEAVPYLEDLQCRLQTNQFLFGPQKGLADITIFPFVRQFSIADPNWFRDQPWADLHTWLDSLIDSDLFRAIMVKYPVWSTGDPEPLFAPFNA